MRAYWGVVNYSEMEQRRWEIIQGFLLKHPNKTKILKHIDWVKKMILSTTKAIMWEEDRNFKSLY